MKNEKLKMKNGFTIIELLVSITIFAIVLTSVVSLFGSALRNQKQLMSQAEVLNSASYVSEYMARALRMAVKDMAGACIGAKNNFVNPNGVSTIRFLNYDSKCQEFGLSSGAIYVKKSTTASAVNLGPATAITAGTNRMTVEKLSFSISGNDQEDIFQPKVAFACEIKSNTKAVNSIKIQTTVSQRNLDVPR